MKLGFLLLVTTGPPHGSGTVSDAPACPAMSWELLVGAAGLRFLHPCSGVTRTGFRLRPPGRVGVHIATRKATGPQLLPESPRLVSALRRCCLGCGLYPSLRHQQGSPGAGGRVQSQSPLTVRERRTHTWGWGWHAWGGASGLAKGSGAPVLCQPLAASQETQPLACASDTWAQLAGRQPPSLLPRAASQGTRAHRGGGTFQAGVRECVLALFPSGKPLPALDSAAVDCFKNSFF